MQPTQFVAYYRVSTAKQGQSGLGLEAQQAACKSYNPIAEFTEVESGKHDDRQQLDQALAFARTCSATLIVAKLDRLSRNAHFILGLMERGVRIRCADMPEADEFQLHLFAILAQKERKMISDRTKAALAAAKERGVKLGGAQASTIARISDFDQGIRTHIQALVQSGAVGPAAIARGLNERAVRTSKGGTWTSGQVVRVMRRLGAG
jgi:DNA invertase Pin-like site-specific DNA recombinase